MRDKKPLRHLHGCSLNRQKFKFKIHDSSKQFSPIELGENNTIDYLNSIILTD